MSLFFPYCGMSSIFHLYSCLFLVCVCHSFVFPMITNDICIGDGRVPKLLVIVTAGVAVAIVVIEEISAQLLLHIIHTHTACLCTYLCACAQACVRMHVPTHEQNYEKT